MTVQTRTLAVGEEGDRRAAQLAAGGATLGQIAAKFDPPLTIEQARAAVERGRRQVSDRAPKPTPPARPGTQPSPPAPDAAEQLLVWAEKEGPSRAVTLAARTRSQLKELADLRDRQQASAQEREVLATLERQLVEARRRLRKMTGTNSARIRAWARDNGYQIGNLGIIRAEIIDAYRAAHGEGAL